MKVGSIFVFLFLLLYGISCALTTTTTSIPFTILITSSSSSSTTTTAIGHSYWNKSGSSWSTYTPGSSANILIDQNSEQLLIDSDPTNMIQMFNAGNYEDASNNSLTDVLGLTVYQGKLYLTASHSLMNDNGGYIFKTDGASDPVPFYQLPLTNGENNQGARLMRVINGKLYVPGTDTNGYPAGVPDSGGGGGIYIYDGTSNTWSSEYVTDGNNTGSYGGVQNSRTDHLVDIVYFNNKYYATVNFSSGANVGETAVVTSLTGNSGSWSISTNVNPSITTALNFPSSYWGITELTIFDNNIYAAAGTRMATFACSQGSYSCQCENASCLNPNPLYEFDGTNWTEIPYTTLGTTGPGPSGNTAPDPITCFAAFNNGTANNLYFGTTSKIYQFNGSTTPATVVWSHSANVWNMNVHNGKLYAGIGNNYISDQCGTSALNGCRWFEYMGDNVNNGNAQIWQTSDGINWTQTAALTTEGAVSSVISFRGRLWAGISNGQSNRGGKLYAAQLYNSGTYVSEPYDTHNTNVTYTISIHQDTVPNTNAGIQIKTSDTQDGLSSLSFTGPGGTSNPSDLYTDGNQISGSEWIQYQVVLTQNNNNKYGPAVNSITIDYTGTPITTSSTPTTSILPPTTSSTSSTSIQPSTSSTSSSTTISSSSTSSSSSTTTVAKTTSTSSVAKTTSTTTVSVTTTIISTTTTVKGICPATKALGGDSHAITTLDMLRDQILAKAATGSQYIALYYKHAPEITHIFESQPELEVKARKLILGLLPAIGDLIARRKAMIQESTVQEGLMVIDNLSSQASPALSEDLRQIRQDIQSGIIFNTFKVKIQK